MYFQGSYESFAFVELLVVSTTVDPKMKITIIYTDTRSIDSFDMILARF